MKIGIYRLKQIPPQKKTKTNKTKKKQKKQQQQKTNKKPQTNPNQPNKQQPKKTPPKQEPKQSKTTTTNKTTACQQLAELHHQNAQEDTVEEEKYKAKGKKGATDGNSNSKTTANSANAFFSPLSQFSLFTDRSVPFN